MVIAPAPLGNLFVRDILMEHVPTIAGEDRAHAHRVARTAWMSKAAAPGRADLLNSCN
jgi:hypothetical protein